MPAKKEEQESKATHSIREAVGEPSYAEKTSARQRAGVSAWRAGAAGATLSSRNPEFMLFSRGIPGFQPAAGPDFLEQSLKNDPDVEILDVLTPRSVFDVLTGLPGPRRVLVARMNEQKASMLANQAGGQIAIEPDLHLMYGQSPGPSLWIGPGDLHQALGFTATFKVTANEAPVEGAEVTSFGSASLSRGVTDRQGELQLDVSGESPNTIHALFVNPRADCWTLWLQEPAINPSGENVIALTPLSATFNGFPKQHLVGWGYKAMKFDQLPPSYRGKGARIAIIDSGVAAGHTALRGQVKSGYDAIMRSQQGWDQDVIGRGTQCAGIISGRSPGGSGIQGVAPEAELIVCKAFPDGSYSNLLEALDFCISQQVDVISLSIGGLGPSQIIEQKILQAKQLGIACIAAAGDSGGPVLYPASSPNVLAVTALGKQGEFPAQSFHAQTVSGITAPSGFYSPNFSSFGPQIGVCAPGVAVVSCVPPDNYAAGDGTAMAAAYISGLAALILAHHPDFQPQAAFSTRNGYRVERLFQLIQQSAQSLNLNDPLRFGAGLPDAAWATMALARPELMPALQYPGFPLPIANPPLTAGNPPFFPAPFSLRPGGSAGVGFWHTPQASAPPFQGGIPNLLMAIQQIRAMMQSAGLL